MSDLRTALAFLTRLPVGVPAEPSLARAAAWFPVVGLLVGGAAAGTRALPTSRSRLRPRRCSPCSSRSS